MHTLILSLNPAIDLEWLATKVQWDQKNTIEAERRWAGGKGVNVARWLRFLGGKPRLIVPLGGPAGQELQHHLRREKIPARIIPLRESTRVDVIVTAPDGRQLRFNPRGPRVSRKEWAGLFQAVEHLLPQSHLLVLSGSLPRGASVALYADLIRRARRYGVKTLLDCDGPAFKAAVEAQPFLVKPNEHELAQWSGKPLRTETALRNAALALSKTTSGWVLLTRGPKSSWLVNAGEAGFMQLQPPDVDILTSNGAGDALLAGVAFQVAKKAAPAEWLQWGVAAGTAATQCPAGQTPKQGVFDPHSLRVKFPQALRHVAAQ